MGAGGRAALSLCGNGFATCNRVDQFQRKTIREENELTEKFVSWMTSRQTFSGD